MSEAERAWAAALESWAIPEHILRAAPEDPWGFPTELFRHAAEESIARASGPSFDMAREALGGGGTVLDVGVGAGAACLPLAPPATFLTGVDQSARMLEAFAHEADQRGVGHREVEGSWPEVAGRVDPADVVVCHHVFYNAPDLGPFVTALSQKARRRVVVELTARHPMSDLNDLWLHFHGLERPSGPTASDAVAVLRELGIEPAIMDWTRPAPAWLAAGPKRVAFVRRRLCVGPERDAEIAQLLEESGRPDRELVTIWWPGPAV
jgi:SAM-dependent methyltransferase